MAIPLVSDSAPASKSASASDTVEQVSGRARQPVAAGDKSARRRAECQLSQFPALKIWHDDPGRAQLN